MGECKNMSLKELLGEELYTQVTEKLGDKRIAVVNDGSYIPKDKFDDKLDEIKSLKDEIKNRDGQIDKLGKSLQGNEDLTNQINTLKADNEAWEGKYKSALKENQVKLKASSLNAHDVNDILSKVDLEKLDLDDNGEIKGLDEVLTQIKTDKPYLFKSEEVPTLGGRTPQNLNTPPKDEITHEQFNKMNYTERVGLYNSNPELYNKLIKG